jgi:4-amino-4-deoxy-L-arabinose transferase-like glycosyltransferase
MTRLARQPLFWILLAAAGLRLAGLFWGLPAADGWDNDGFTPRNFLTALALTWKPGSFFTYPPLHALLLAVPSLPVAAWALAHAPSLSQHDVIATITSPVYMTVFAVIGRFVGIAMSLGIIWCVGEMARLIAGARAGLFAAAACALSVLLTYYGQVGNLDVPYLFWSMLSLLAVMRAIAGYDIRQLWWAALLAAAAIATKDQAYAVFALSLPLVLLLWFVADAWPRENSRKIAMTLVPAAAVALFALLLVDGVITNPSGFLRRVAFLTGPASQDYAEYLQGPQGWWALLRDMAIYFGHGTGWCVLVLAALGVGLHLRRSAGALRMAGLLPLLAILSFIICFNFAALRSDDRFLLPQAVLACVYIGIAADALAFSRPARRLAGRFILATLAVVALHHVIGVNAAMLMDPRYDAERWMAAHVAPGDTVEIYGQNCFQPRFAPGMKVSRVGQGALNVRNPLPGVTELRQPFSAPRGSRFIVVSAVWARRYLRPQVPLGAGRIYSKIQQADFANEDARGWFAGLRDGGRGYRLVHASSYNGAIWPAVHIHDSLAGAIWIYERVS